MIYFWEIKGEGSFLVFEQGSKIQWADYSHLTLKCLVEIIHKVLLRQIILFHLCIVTLAGHFCGVEDTLLRLEL